MLHRNWIIIAQKKSLHMGKQDEFLWNGTPMGEKIEEEVAEFLRK
mgnify:CR=1 FL=1